MASVTLTRRIALVAGGAAIVAMASVTAGCSSSTKEAPATSSTTAPASASTSAAQPSPTDKVTIIQPVPSIEDRGGMDSHGCPPGHTKYNGVCQ